MRIDSTLIFPIALLLSANLIRIIRWNNWLKAVNHSPNSRSTSAYLLGQIANIFLPYKVGDLLRVFLTRKSKFEIVSILSLLFLERFLDGLLFLLFFVIIGISPGWYLYTIILTGIFIILVSRFLIPILRGKLFTENLSAKYLFWSIRRSCERQLLVMQLFLTTVIWTMTFFADYLILSELIPGELRKESTDNYFSSLYGLYLVPNFEYYDSQLLVLLSIPILSLMAILVSKNFSNAFKFNFANNDLGDIATLARVEFDHFIVDLRKFKAIINPLENLIGSFRTGSNAHVVLVQRSDGIQVVRKFAEGVDARTLEAQFNFLLNFEKSVHTPDVLKIKNSDDFFCYEMNFISSAMTAEEFIDRESVEHVFLFEKIGNAYLSTFQPDAIKSSECFEVYLNNKTQRFIASIQAAKLDEQVRDLAVLEFEKHIAEIHQISTRIEIDKRQYLGHGDLSSTNVLVSSESIVFIDFLPNQEWLSITSDFAKMYFSFSSGIERHSLEIEGSRELPQARSSVFAVSRFSLANEFLFFSKNRLGIQPEEMILQSMVHLFRVIPYKLGDDKEMNQKWCLFAKQYLESEFSRLKALGLF